MKTCQKAETSSQSGEEEDGQKKTGKEGKAIGSPQGRTSPLGPF
jgi:hypothetical protein